MITPAYPNQRRHEGILEELKRQIIEYPHYIYLEEEEIFSAEQPRIANPLDCYEVFAASPNTVLFWSSKTRLHSTKAIYRMQDRTVSFDLVIDMAQEDFNWVFRNLCLAAFGVRFGLKQKVEWVKLPKCFAEPLHPKMIVEGEFVRMKLEDM